MPKRVPVEAKRVSLNCLVLPETLAWLRSVDVSQGVAVDRAVHRAKAHEADGWQEIPIFGPPSIKTRDSLTVSFKRHKPPLLKPSEKRK